MLGEIIAQNRRLAPLVHCIANHVSANDCANILLASGASAIMADDPDEAAEVTSICAGLVLNLGTPNPRKLQAMLLSGKQAMDLGRPVVLDPVGVGCSSLRRESVREMLSCLRFAAIRGNASEIALLAGQDGPKCGVDAAPAGPQAIENARQLARKTGAVVVMTGPRDIITDGVLTYSCKNGHPMMRNITGTGCQLSALMGAYIAANPDRPLQAALAAVCAMGLCGETAHARLSPLEGSATMRAYIIDAICHLTPEDLEEGANYELHP